MTEQCSTVPLGSSLCVFDSLRSTYFPKFNMLQLTGTELAKDEQDQAKKILFTYPMVKETDMNEDMRSEVMDICVNACEKHTSNNESAAKMIKEVLDKKFGSSWHVVVGEGFGFEVSYEIKNLMYMFFAGNLAVCAWKCA